MKWFRRNKKKVAPVELCNSKNPELELIFTSSSGIAFYGFKDIMSIPAIRAIAGERASRFAEMLMTESFLKQAVKQIKDCFNKGKYIEAAAIINEIDVRLNLFAEESCLLELASCYVLLEDEKPAEIQQSFHDRKLEFWKQDYPCRAFFLTMVLKLIKKYSNISDQDFLQYLKDIEKVTEKLRSVTG
jgi:hypothetical protein